MSTRVAVIVGNPKAESRTLSAAVHVAEELTGSAPDLVVDLATVGGALLDWQDPTVSDLVEQVRSADLVVVASPTYKATYTGLLKLFLDAFPYDGLRGTIAVPLMLGAGLGHTLAPELGLRSVLVELGANVPVRSLFVLEKSYDDPGAYTAWLETARSPISAALTSAEDVREGAIR
jgi:FMN reductase